MRVLLLMFPWLLVACSGERAVESTPAPPMVAAAPAVDRSVPGIDTSELGEQLRERFFNLLDVTPAPCGRPMSLRAALRSEPGCARAPFAARYLLRMVKENQTDLQIGHLYDRRYRTDGQHTFVLDDGPRSGKPTAPVVLVEFFDYACPHCREFAPQLEEIVQRHADDLVVYYKYMPIGMQGHESSVPAAMASLAAHWQGRFHEMHRTLFANQGRLDRAGLVRIAKEVGLVMSRFESDRAASKARARVERDRAEGEKAKVGTTPAIFLQGRRLAEVERQPAQLEALIEEELAVAKAGQNRPASQPAKK